MLTELWTVNRQIVLDRNTFFNRQEIETLKLARKGTEREIVDRIMACKQTDCARQECNILIDRKLRS